MLTFISSDYYFNANVNVYSAQMTAGELTGKRFRGCIAWPLPFGNVKTVTKNVSEFSSYHSGFFNLNNCYHSKADGVVISRPGIAVTPPPTDSMFGPMVCYGGSNYANALVNSPFELYVRTYGDFNNCKLGTWSFGLGIAKFGDTIISVVGFPDLEGDRNFIGSYSSFQAFEMIQINATEVKYRTITYTPPVAFRTSSMTPLEAITRYQSLISSDLHLFKWTNYKFADLCLSGDPVHSTPIKDVTINSEATFLLSDRNPNWGALASKAYQSVKFFNSNGIALVGDLARLKADLSSTKNLVSMASSAGAKPAVIAKLFLAFYYGWRLLVLDLKGVSDAARSIAKLTSRNQKCSANVTWEVGGTVYRAFFHCYYERYGQLASQIDSLISEFGLELNFSNIWDMIPFSFVVDWFTGVGGLLDQLDSYYQITQEHKIVCTGKSIKCQRRVDSTTAGLIGWLGAVNITLYKREYSDDVTYPQFSFSTPKTFNHYVEGTALIVSRR